MKVYDKNNYHVADIGVRFLENGSVRYVVVHRTEPDREYNTLETAIKFTKARFS